MSLGIIMLLILLGLIFVLLEILVIPGVGIVGIAGGILIVIAIYGAYSIEMMYGHIALVSSLVLSIFSIYFSLKSTTWKKATLSDSIESKVNIYDEQDIKIGSTGITLSRLALVGKARINEKMYEVESLKGFIDPQVKIVVVKITGSKIVVKPDEFL